MTPSHAGKKGTHYRYYVSGSLFTKDRTETSAGLRIPAVESEQLVSARGHRWLLDAGTIYKSTAAWLPDHQRSSGLSRGLQTSAGTGPRWPWPPNAPAPPPPCARVGGGWGQR